MLYHLVHRAVLQEVAFFVAVLAIIEVRAAVHIRSAVLDTS